MADTRELYIKTKVEDMIVYGNICLKQFPKHERYALASEIRLCMYRILGIVIETNHKHYKENYAYRTGHRSRQTTVLSSSISEPRT